MKRNTIIKFSLSGAVVLVSLMTLSLVVSAAKKVAAPKPAAVKEAGKNLGDKGKIVAEIGSVKITVADLEERINKQIPFIRKRYTDEGERKKFLESIVDFEVLAMEAKAQGLDKKPDVITALRKVMIHRQRQSVLDSRVKLDMITDAEVKSYYDKHVIEFKRPERRRAAIIVTKTKDEAVKVLDEVNKIKGNLRKFQQLVKKYSIDTETQKRGGLLPFFDIDAKNIEKAIIETTFNMKKAGDISQVITVKAGFAVIRLSGVSPKVDKPVDQVAELIKKRLLKDKQQKAFKDYVDELKKSAKITVFEDKLDLVKIDASPRTMGGGFQGPGGKFNKMPGNFMKGGMGPRRGRPARMPHGMRMPRGMGPQGHKGHSHQ
ncbi:peptidyl-prolyl cis-trans isomerase [Myxococcota bacterium]|nr:peptidyl-prolyl cis-trans isomerase [Myxococcota bacterium]